MSEHSFSEENSDSTDSEGTSSSGEFSDEATEQIDMGFMPYDPSVEPIATEEQAAAFAQERQEEEEEETEFQARFSGEKDVNSWCKCGNCSIQLIMKPHECRCCTEVDACAYSMEDCGVPELLCITGHPGYETGCLDPWVLRLAAIGLKTRGKKSYTYLVDNAQRTEAELMRAVAYRQLTRLIYGYTGRGLRYPLPCCSYNSIRTAFPSEAYRGFEDEDDNEA